MDDFALAAPGPAEIPAIPPSSPPLDENDIAVPRSAHSADEKLDEAAFAVAGSWKLLPARDRSRFCSAKWRESSKRIEEIIRALKSNPGDPDSFSADERWFLENARLLRGAIQEIRSALAVFQKLPQIVTHGAGPRHLQPRAYAASGAYLRETDFVFDERTFLGYLRALQERGSFEIAEIWALQPLLQLVVLEEIASSVAEAPLATLITSLREIANSDWRDLFEKLNKVESVLREDLHAYSRMDAESRDLYRRAVQELSRHSETSEFMVARTAMALAAQAAREIHPEPRVTQHRSHVGYYLIGHGRKRLEKHIGYRPPFSKEISDGFLDWPEGFYLGGIGLLTLAIVSFVLSGLGTTIPLITALLLLWLPAVDAAIGVMNQVVAFVLPPRSLPKLDFSEGIPSNCTTMVAVSTLLIDERQVRQMVRDLEVRYLGNRDSNLHFALLTDAPDSLEPMDQAADLAPLCSNLIEELNRKYFGQTGGQFYHFHRHLVFNPIEGTWMGWERKSGKLLDFNNLLRGGFDSFPVKVGDLSILPKVHYVIALDADTQLPRESAHRLVGAMAHPLNRAVVDPSTNTVIEGYGILQPRVGISVRSANRSRLANIFSGQTGFDIYTRAVSDVYQDLVGEGSFAGKGIYEVDIFQRVLSDRFPLNAILSHDLIEGAYVRAGLLSDVEVIDDYPSHFSAYSRRKHRWVRGDWQIMRWLLPRVPGFSGKMVTNPISVISRWKILDNLRRSLIETAIFVLLLAGWFWLPGGPVYWTVAVLALLLIPAYIRLALALLTLPQVENLRGFLHETADAFVAEQVNVFMILAFLAHQVLVTLDAIIRTVVRLTITRRNLLEWETAAESESETTRSTPVDFYLRLTPFVSVVLAVALYIRGRNAWAAAPLLALWAASGELSKWLNRPLRSARSEITDSDEWFLRDAVLRTWRFFRASSNAENNWLIPDNIQLEPPAVAQRISPTNLGLLFNARLAAYKMGYLTVSEFAGETEKTVISTRCLQRYDGHFFNWYDTRTLLPIEPLFVSTVDSGNLAGCLWSLKQGCLQAVEQPILHPNLWQGVADHLHCVIDLTRAAAVPEISDTLTQLEAGMAVSQDDPAAWFRTLPDLESALARIDAAAESDLHWWLRESEMRLASLRRLAEMFTPWWLPEHAELLATAASDARDVTLATLADFAADPALQPLSSRLAGYVQAARELREKLESIAQQADSWVRQMDFRALYNPRRKVLSVGYDVARQRLEKNCYELLASEARMASFVAIAKGDVPQQSWVHLGRSHTICDGRRVLLSWSGTMFEYMMPALWMRTFPNTLLERSLTAVVHCQRQVSERRHVPWGISESAWSHRDEAGHYQYFAFGLRRLAVRPSSQHGLVVSPYSAFLALAASPRAVLENLKVMKTMGWLGSFGFFESADFSSSNVRDGESHELVRSWMSHHQGMILLAACNLLGDGCIQDLFHAEPLVAATERLLHERLPQGVSVERSDELSPAA